MVCRSRVRTAFSVIAFLFMATLVVGGVAAAGQAEGGDVVRMRLAHVNAPNDAVGQAADKLAELAREYSNGSIEITVYHQSQLGNNAEILSGVSSSTIEMGIVPFPNLSDIVPEYLSYLGGFFYDDFAGMQAVYNHEELGRAWNRTLIERAGIRVLDIFYYGARSLTTRGRPVYSPADMTGLKIRAVPNAMSLAVVRGMGAEPTTVNLAEVFQSLSQRIVDGQENPLLTIYANKFHEVQDYLMLTRHQRVILPFVIEERIFAGMSPSQQDALLRAARDAGEFASQLTIDEENRLVDRFKELGVTVIGPDDGLDIAAFQQRVRPSVIAQFSDTWPQGLVDRIVEVSSNR